MKEIIFDIKKYSYVNNEECDVSFIPMLTRRKLNKFGRCALYTLYKVYNGGNPRLVFASEYGDTERVDKLIKQRQEDGEVSPTGFSSSVHNASIGLFSLLENNKTGYNSISAGKKTIAIGFLESILSNNTIFCYTESLNGLKSVSLSIETSHNGEFLLTENNQNCTAKDSFEDFIKFLDGKQKEFISDTFKVQRITQ